MLSNAINNNPNDMDFSKKARRVDTHQRPSEGKRLQTVKVGESERSPILKAEGSTLSGAPQWSQFHPYRVGKSRSDYQPLLSHVVREQEI